MRQILTKRARRQMRRAIGTEYADLVDFDQARIQIAVGVIRRGFFGRLRWLLFGI